MSAESAGPSGDARPHLLVVDDDERLRDLLGRYLAENGHEVDMARDAAEARRRLGAVDYDLVVLDVTMPGEDGLSLARSLREGNGSLPILLLTARRETEHRIAGLETGADDYMGKPFEPRELLLRVGALLRRARGGRPAGWVHFGPFAYDRERRELWRDARRVPLTAREAEMLAALAAEPGRPVSRERLAAETGVRSRSVDVQVGRLRRKLGEGGGPPRHLVSVRGRGYALRAEAA